ncbi:MAG TPA: Rieske 2Fe-2S domain-containing protein [Candidatus Dormibacteraeota bacterium]|nr:Rieske 2Fe-2S domain-containing protein [Candidatus Dormibacteraeota bacterium]
MSQGQEVGSAEYVRVASVGEVPVGEALQVTVEGREIALFRLEDGWYALDNVCPHQGGPLSEGWIEGRTVTCPWHAWCFDLGSGALTLGPFAGVDAFDVRVEGDEVLVAAHPRGHA